MKFTSLALTALLGNLSFDQVQSLTLNQALMAFEDPAATPAAAPVAADAAAAPVAADAAAAKSKDDGPVLSDDKIVEKKYKAFKDDIKAGMKRDNVWTNGTKAKISGAKGAEGASTAKGEESGEYSKGEDWTRNMPSHIVDDNMGPTTSRTAAPPMTKIDEGAPKIQNITMKAPTKTEVESGVADAVADVSTPKAASATPAKDASGKVSSAPAKSTAAKEKAVVGKTSDKVGVDIAAGAEAEKKIVAEAKAEAKIEQAEAAAEAKEEVKAEEKEEKEAAAKKTESGKTAKGGSNSSSAANATSGAAGGASGKSASSAKADAVNSEKSSADIVSEQDSKAVAGIPKAQPTPVPEVPQGTRNDVSVEITPNNTVSAQPSGLPAGFPAEMGFSQKVPAKATLLQYKFTPQDKFIPKSIVDKSIDALMQDPQKIKVM